MFEPHLTVGLLRMWLGNDPTTTEAPPREFWQCLGLEHALRVAVPAAAAVRLRAPELAAQPHAWRGEVAAELPRIAADAQREQRAVEAHTSELTELPAAQRRRRCETRPRPHLGLAVELLELAEEELAAGTPAAAAETIEAARAVAHAAHQKDRASARERDLVLLRAGLQLALVARGQGDLAAAERDALTWVRFLPSSVWTPAALATSLRLRAALARDRGQLRESASRLRRGLRPEVFDPRTELRVRRDLGSSYLATGQPELALEALAPLPALLQRLPRPAPHQTLGAALALVLAGARCPGVPGDGAFAAQLPLLGGIAPGSPLRLEAALGLGLAAAAGGQREEATRLFTVVVTTPREHLTDRSAARVAQAAFALAEITTASGATTGAVGAARVSLADALEGLVGAPGVGHPGLARWFATTAQEARFGGLDLSRMASWRGFFSCWVESPALEPRFPWPGAWSFGPGDLLAGPWTGGRDGRNGPGRRGRRNPAKEN